MIKEGKRLHALGFAIHWLRPNSKQPIEKGWTKGDRKNLTDLTKLYNAGFNMGVRLGRVSKLRDTAYLTVIDCDVKSKDPTHLAEMESKLKELIGDTKATPTVMSGRGNGSKHLYVASHEPFRTFLYARSSQEVKLEMRSAEPSKRELGILTPDEIKNGTRLRAAWEISLMSEGSQVVLPPSTHPDTGRTYKWSIPVYSGSDIQTYSLPTAGVGPKLSRKTVRNFSPIDVDLLDGRLHADTVDLIISGKGCKGDLSNSVWAAVNPMVKAGLTDEEIMSVLTDRGYYLGNVSYEHRHSSDISSAADWILNYNILKARHENAAENDFKNEAFVEEPPLTPDMTKTQHEEVTTIGGWEADIERNQSQGGAQGKPKNTLKNVDLILTNVVAKDLFARDEFAIKDFYLRDAPWGAKKGSQVKDQDITEIILWFAEHWRFEPSDDKVIKAITHIAYQNRFHPVRSYLLSLNWDGVKRIDSWLKNYLGSTGPEPYLSEIGRKTLVAMVRRVFEPGCKFDHVLILEGEQGSGKSSTVRVLGGEWYSDAPIIVGEKDTVLDMQGKWDIELGELATMRKAEINALKAFITRTSDRVRMPYGRLSEDHPRQCVFIGTTNNDEYLNDPTGNRRFWPVKVGECNFKKLEKDRNQLLAEAKVFYDLGETIYLDDKITERQAMAEQTLREIYDDLQTVLKNFLKTPNENFPINGFEMADLFSDFGPKMGCRLNPYECHRIKVVLKKLGFQERRIKGNRVWTR